MNIVGAEDRENHSFGFRDELNAIVVYGISSTWHLTHTRPSVSDYWPGKTDRCEASGSETTRWREEAWTERKEPEENVTVGSKIENDTPRMAREGPNTRAKTVWSGSRGLGRADPK